MTHLRAFETISDLSLPFGGTASVPGWNETMISKRKECKERNASGMRRVEGERKRREEVGEGGDLRSSRDPRGLASE